MIVLVVVALSAALGNASTHLALLFFQAFKVPTSSMAPTIQGASVGGDYVLVQKYAYWVSEPKRGDVVLFDMKAVSDGLPGSVFYAKRLVGLPGDKLEQIGRTLYVNGHPMNEAYAQYIDPTSVNDHYGPYPVPLMQYFVIGDNRDNSQDSRHYGPIPKNSIIGRVSKIYWPPRRAGAVR
jgi:signal peptidase I